MAFEKLTARLDAVTEYEREPIPAGKLKGWRSFLGMYAGEHTAGTEFVIGPHSNDTCPIFTTFTTLQILSDGLHQTGKKWKIG